MPAAPATAGRVRSGDPRPDPAEPAGDHALPLPGGAGALPMLRARCAALARRHAVPGAQLVISRHGATLALELGELEHRTGRPVSRDSAFPIGSITKTFTAALAMALVADGDLELDTPVGQYLPQLATLSRGVTLRRLLSHTSGLAAGPDSDDVAGASPARYLSDHCRPDDQVVRPGHGFSYSNAGYVAVGELVTAVTGMSWAEAVESIVARPLGIAPAHVGRAAAEVARPVASGHAGAAARRTRANGGHFTGGTQDVQSGRSRPVRQTLAPAEAAAGALAVSAVDLVRLGAALIDPAGSAVLPAEQAGWMREPQPGAEPFGLADGWGLGLALFDRPGGGPSWVGHDGNGLGTACYLRADPVDGWLVAFTSNANTGLALWQEICAQLRLLGIGVPLVASTAEGLPLRAVPRGCAGRYANGGAEFTVSVRDGQAILAVDDELPVRMTFHDGLIFSVPDPDTRRPVLGGRFTRDPNTGQIDGVQIAGRVARRNHRAYDSRPSRIA